MMIYFYLIADIFLVSILFYCGNNYLFFQLFFNIKIQRFIHYELLFLLGVILALKNLPLTLMEYFQLNPHSIMDIILGFFVVLFVWLGLTAKEIISFNVSRYTPGPHADNKNLFYSLIFFTLLYSFVINVKAGFLASLILASFYLYTTPPLQLKRIIIFSKLLLAINAIALSMLGYLIIFQYQFGFPKILFLLYFIGYTLAANLIDLSDKDAYIETTLYKIIGMKYTKILIGVMMWLLYVGFYFIIKNTYIGLALIFVGGIQFLLINKKNYQESTVLGFSNLVLTNFLISLIALA
jgi:hypothetical protein